MLTRMKRGPEKQKLVVTTPGADFDFYAGIPTADDTLAFFLLTLNCCLNVARLRNVELQDHWSILGTAFQDDLISGSSGTRAVEFNLQPPMPPIPGEIDGPAPHVIPMSRAVSISRSARGERRTHHLQMR